MPACVLTPKDVASYPGIPTEDLVYDWVGNRTNPGGFGYNLADQLTNANGHTYGYDDAQRETVVLNVRALGEAEPILCSMTDFWKKLAGWYWSPEGREPPS